MTILLWIFSNYEILPILGIPLLVVSLVAYLLTGKTPVDNYDL